VVVVDLAWAHIERLIVFERGAQIKTYGNLNIVLLRESIGSP